MTKKLVTTFQSEDSFQKELDKMVQEDSASNVICDTPIVDSDMFEHRAESSSESDSEEDDDEIRGIGIVPYSSNGKFPEVADNSLSEQPCSDNKLQADCAYAAVPYNCRLPIMSPVARHQDDSIPFYECESREQPTSKDLQCFRERMAMETEPTIMLGNNDRLNSEGEENNASVLSYHEAMDGSTLPKEFFQFSLADDLRKLTVQDTQKLDNSHEDLNTLKDFEWTESFKEQQSAVPLLYTKNTNFDKGDFKKPQNTGTVTIRLSSWGVKRLSEATPNHMENISNEMDSPQETIVGQFPDISPEMTSTQNEEGDTILHMAIINHAIDMVYFVLAAVPSHLILDILNHMTQTPLHLSVLMHQHGVVRRLVARGARIDTRDRYGNTALHLACKSGCLECAKALSTPVHHSEIGKCAYRVPFQCIPQDPCTLNYDGLSCLHLAAQTKNVELTRYLLSPEVGHDVNIQDARTGRTILHNCVLQRHLNILMLLIENRHAFKLDVNVEAFDGHTAMDIASDTKQSDIMFLLSIIGTKHGIG